MIKKSFAIVILFWVSCLLMSCAGSKFIPEGSQSLGVYEASFSGDMYGGSLRIHLFQTLAGEKLFKATLNRDTSNPYVVQTYFVRGKMTASSLEGKVEGKGSGSLTGNLSSDGKRLTGSFNVTAPDLCSGTWQAQKK